MLTEKQWKLLVDYKKLIQSKPRHNDVEDNFYFSQKLYVLKQKLEKENVDIKTLHYYLRSGVVD